MIHFSEHIPSTKQFMSVKGDNVDDYDDNDEGDEEEECDGDCLRTV